MSLTFHATTQTPLLIPVLPPEPSVVLLPETGSPGTTECIDRTASISNVKESHLCQAIIRQVAQVRALALCDPVTPDALAALLTHVLHHHATRLLIVPWNLQQSSSAMLSAAMGALQQTGTKPVSLSGLLPVVAMPDIAPQGPLGGLLSPQPRLDRAVERWPGWRQVYTLLATEHVSLVCIHPFAPHAPLLHQRSSPEEAYWKQTVAACCQRAAMPSSAGTIQRHAQKTLAHKTTLRRDGELFARYLTGIVCAAVDVLCSPRPERQKERGYDR